MAHVVTIDGKEYRLEYPYPMKRAIERRSEKTVWDTCFSGMEDDLLTILWAGLNHIKPQHYTRDVVEEMIDKHVEHTNTNPSPIYVTALRAVFDSNLVKVNREAVKVLLDRIEGATGDGEGKGQAEN